MTDKKIIICTGITGQVASYMAKSCLDDGNLVIGLIRRSSAPNFERIKDIVNHENLTLVEGDGTDSIFINNFISKYKPDIVYNFMAQSHVATSFIQPAYTEEITGKSVLYLLESIKAFSPKTKLIQASSSEQFGDQFDIDEFGNKYQDENTQMKIQSPYANSKLQAYNYVRLYRKSYNLFSSNIIMFNCESEHRGENFVTRKITKHVAKLYDGIKRDKYICYYEKLRLGNLDSFRDWGYVSDYIKAYKLAAEYEKPDDFVVCTGETHSIREFLTEAFSLIGIKDWTPYVEIDESLKRPSEVPYLCGRYDKAKRILGWEPKVKFKELVKIMVDADIKKGVTC